MAPKATKDIAHIFDQNRCLITNLSSKSCQELAHLIAHSTGSSEMQKLMKAWGYKKNHEFDKDKSPENFITLGADWHKAFDRDLWAVLPPVEILRKIKEYPMGTYTDPYPGYEADKKRPLLLHVFDGFDFLFIIRENDKGDKDIVMDQETLARYPKFKPKETVNDGMHTMYYGPPFLDFPRLYHLAHPFALIYNAYRKVIKNVEDRNSLQLDRRLEHLTLVWEIGDRWWARFDSLSLGASDPAASIASNVAGPSNTQDVIVMEEKESAALELYSTAGLGGSRPATHTRRASEVRKRKLGEIEAGNNT